VKNTLTIVVASILAGALVLPCAAQTAGANSNAATKKSSAGKTEASPPPSAQDIANAKSQGSVWVNLNTRVYHKGGDLYGKTKHGKFMNEDDAKKQGFREAEEPKTAKKKGAKKAPADQSGVDATINTHTSTPPKP
jgi:hypothetical protein